MNLPSLLEGAGSRGLPGQLIWVNGWFGVVKFIVWSWACGGVGVANLTIKTYIGGRGGRDRRSKNINDRSYLYGIYIYIYIYAYSHI